MIKKILAIFILCISLVITGCTSSDLNIGVNVNKILNKLYNTVNNIDTIDNNYIVNPDISSTNQIQKSNIISSKNTLETNYIDNTNDKLNTSRSELIESLPFFKNRGPNETNSNLIYRFSEENFTPENLKYNPRYISTYNTSNTSENLNNYIYKIQKLYAISEDVVEANNMLNMYQKNTLTSINIIKEINNELINLNKQPSNQKVIAINNYLNDLKQTNNLLKDCNGDLNNEITNITSKTTTGITNSIEIINSNYIKILNQIDTRINYFENALTSLEQLKFIIEDSIAEIKSALNSENFTSNINTYKNKQENLNNESNNTENNALLDNINSEAVNPNSSNIDSYKPTNKNNSTTTTTPINESETNFISENNYNQDIENNNPNNNFNTTTKQLNNNLNKPTSQNNQNGIINENNINNANNNNNLYYYDNNGKLYNSKNNNYAFNNAKNNTNVDTYNYNTLVDIINQGTIDNGINSLTLLNKISLKPVMVNNNNNNELVDNKHEFK